MLNSENNQILSYLELNTESQILFGEHVAYLALLNSAGRGVKVKGTAVCQSFTSFLPFSGSFLPLDLLLGREGKRE